MKKISKYIQEQNEKIYAPQGLLLTDPIERGLRVVSFSVAAQPFVFQLYEMQQIICSCLGEDSVLSVKQLIYVGEHYVLPGFLHEDHFNICGASQSLECLCGAGEANLASKTSFLN